MPFFHLLGAVTALVLVAPAAAQVPASPQSPPAIEGRWSGTVQLNDGSQTLQAVYTFTRGPGGLTGTASSAEQGTADVTEIRQDGASVSWMVILPLGAFVHEGSIADGGIMKGTVTLDGVSVARFSLTRAP